MVSEASLPTLSNFAYTWPNTGSRAMGGRGSLQERLIKVRQGSESGYRHDNLIGSKRVAKLPAKGPVKFYI